MSSAHASWWTFPGLINTDGEAGNVLSWVDSSSVAVGGWWGTFLVMVDFGAMLWSLQVFCNFFLDIKKKKTHKVISPCWVGKLSICVTQFFLV